MLVKIENSGKLQEMEAATGIPANVLVNQIIDIHLDETKRADYLKMELARLFTRYKEIHNIK